MLLSVTPCGCYLQAPLAWGPLKIFQLHLFSLSPTEAPGGASGKEKWPLASFAGWRWENLGWGLETPLHFSYRSLLGCCSAGLFSGGGGGWRVVLCNSTGLETHVGTVLPQGEKSLGFSMKAKGMLPRAARTKVS